MEIADRIAEALGNQAMTAGQILNILRRRRPKLPENQNVRTYVASVLVAAVNPDGSKKFEHVSRGRFRVVLPENVVRLRPKKRGLWDHLTDPDPF